MFTLIALIIFLLWFTGAVVFQVSTDLIHFLLFLALAAFIYDVVGKRHQGP